MTGIAVEPRAEVGWLTCLLCGRTKAPVTFPVDRTGPAGRYPVCHACGGAKLARGKRERPQSKPKSPEAPRAQPTTTQPGSRVCGGCRQQILILPQGASPCGCAAKRYPASASKRQELAS